MNDSVDACCIKVIRRPAQLARLVLFVTHAPAGQIKPHVPRYTEAFRQEGLSVVVIVVADAPDTVDIAAIEPFCDGLMVRENGGYDFAAWAHACKLLEIRDTRLLILANDSLVGPLDHASFARLMRRIETSTADLIGMTDSYEMQHHYQSYLIAAKDCGVACVEKFLAGVHLLADKTQVIRSYELSLLSTFKAEGLVCTALFPVAQGDRRNASIVHWKSLVDRGFPFIKTLILQGLPRSEWQPVVEGVGYPVAVVERAIDMLGGALSETGDNKTLAVSEEKLRDIIWVRTNFQKGNFGKAEATHPSANQVKYLFYRIMAALCRPVSASLAQRYEMRAGRRKTP